MTDTCVSGVIDHISEPGKALDGMETGTESVIFRTTGTLGNSSLKMDKARRLMLMMYWLVPTIMITLTSIGVIPLELGTPVIVVMDGQVR